MISEVQFITLPNRASRRAYQKQVRNDPDALKCPRCGFKTKHIAVRPDGSEADICAVVCQACRHILTYIPRHESGTYVKAAEIADIPKGALLS